MRENNSLANVERFNAMQKWDYKRKVAHAQEMAEAFYSWARHWDIRPHRSKYLIGAVTTSKRSLVLTGRKNTTAFRTWDLWQARAADVKKPSS